MRIEYSQAVLDTDTGELVSAAEVAEMPYLAFTHTAPLQGRLIVRQSPNSSREKLADAAQRALCTVPRYRAPVLGRGASVVAGWFPLGRGPNPAYDSHRTELSTMPAVEA